MEVEYQKFRYMAKEHYIYKEKGSKKNQQNFFHSSQENATVLTKPNSILSLDEQVVKAETLWALKCVNSNMSFASANGDGDMFRQMFPDSRIAENYKQNETKIVSIFQGNFK